MRVGSGKTRGQTLWGLTPLLVLLAGCTSTPGRYVLPEYSLSEFVPGSAMHGVHGLAFDREDRLYGASLIGYSVYRIDTETGDVTTVVGPPLGNADDVAVGPDGTLAWTAGAFSAVHALPPGGDVTVLADGLPGVNSINYADDGRLFVTQVFGGDALWEIDPAGAADKRRIARRLGGLNGFEVGPDGFLYGPLFLQGRVVRVDVDSGAVTDVADGFTVPAAVNFDSQGRLYVVDFDDGTITRLDLESGARETVATLEPPLDNLAINSRDELYVSNPAINAITAVNPDTGATRVVTTGHTSGPGGIALADVDGRAVLFVADFWGNRHFDVESGARTMWKPPPGVLASASVGTSDRHLALASIWPLGFVYVIDRERNKVVKSGKFQAPYNPVFFADGSLVVADYAAGTLTRFAPGDSRDKTEFAVGLEGPVGLATDGDALLYVSEYDAGRIWRLDVATGQRELIAEWLERPEGLALDGEGRLLIAETGTQSLLRFDPRTGAIVTVADSLAIGLEGGDDMPAPFIPTGIAVDANGTIFVSADRANAIYRLTPQ